MADFNVTEKTLLEKIQDLLERKQENYDLAFCVGKEKKIVRAVKIILKASSLFLEKQFEEKWEVAVVKEGDGIPLPDFDPIAFELFVKLTSLDTWSLEILKALNLALTQILNLLLICRCFEMQKAVEKLEKLATIFLQSFGEYKDTDDFLELSQTNLKYVLGSDDIEIEELGVFYAAMRWADFQCRRMEVLATEEQIRAVLGDCLFEIRFPMLTCAEFTEARKSKDVLTAEESLGVYGFIGSTGNKTRNTLLDVKNFPFKTTPRNKAQKLKSNPNPETNNSKTSIHSEISRLCVTRGSENAKNSPIVWDESRNTQFRPASSFQLSAGASLSKRIRWGKKIDGFPPRSERAAVAVGTSIYSFGGDSFSGDPNYSRDVLDCFVLNVNKREKKWNKLSVASTEMNPNQRWAHSAVAHKECVLIFGGKDTKKDKYSNSTYRFNTKTLKWDKPKVTGNVPHSRFYHTAVVFGNQMLICGGMGEGVTKDLHCLDLEHFRWSTIETKGIPPSIRHGHSATVHNDSFILIFGGWDYENVKRVNTLHSFDLSNNAWTAVETRGTPPSIRIVYNGRMYIFGGCREYGFYFNDVFCYDPETFEWKEVTPNGQAPSRRYQAECAALHDQVFIFGGYCFEGYEFDDKVLSDTCVLHM